MGVQWLLAGSGPLSAGAGQVGGAACTEYAIGGRPDVQFQRDAVCRSTSPAIPLHRLWPDSRRRSGNAMRSRAESLRSVRPIHSSSRVFEPNYFAEEIDRKTIVAGLHILRGIYQQKSFRELWDIEMVPGEAVQQARPALWDFARTTGGTVFSLRRQPAGWEATTNRCSIPRCAFRGVERLRVIDASVMPQITSANTNASSLMIGERGAGPCHVMMAGHAA